MSELYIALVVIGGLVLLVGVVLGPVVLDVLDLARWGSQDIICASIVAHGVTATPLMRLYGRGAE